MLFVVIYYIYIYYNNIKVRGINEEVNRIIKFVLIDYFEVVLKFEILLLMIVLVLGFICSWKRK